MITIPCAYDGNFKQRYILLSTATKAAIKRTVCTGYIAVTHKITLNELKQLKYFFLGQKIAISIEDTQLYNVIHYTLNIWRAVKFPHDQKISEQ